MKSKNPHSNKRFSSLSFSRVTKTDFRTLLSWRERGLTPKLKKAIMQEYLEWVEIPTSLDYLDFLHEVGIPLKTFQGYCRRDEDIKAVHEYVKTLLGSRFQKIARFPKKYDANPDAFMKTLRFYHKDWRDTWNEEADMRTKAAKAGAGFTGVVEIPAIPDCPEVPKKPEVTE